MDSSFIWSLFVSIFLSFFNYSKKRIIEIVLDENNRTIDAHFVDSFLGIEDIDFGTRLNFSTEIIVFLGWAAPFFMHTKGGGTNFVCSLRAKTELDPLSHY